MLALSVNMTTPSKLFTPLTTSKNTVTVHTQQSIPPNTPHFDIENEYLFKQFYLAVIKTYYIKIMLNTLTQHKNRAQTNTQHLKYILNTISIT
jgi:hypothetical protein